jgi:hypothetical protein
MTPMQPQVNIAQPGFVLSMPAGMLEFARQSRGRPGQIATRMSRCSRTAVSAARTEELTELDERAVAGG